MEIRLLGTVEALVDGQPLPLGPRQRRLLLAVLAWEADRLVPVDRLVSLVWPESPPRSASHAVRVMVSQLRALFAEAGAACELETRGTGYLLRADPMTVDVRRFLTLVGQARKTADDPGRLAVLEEALGLWRGPVMADVATDQTRELLAAGVREARLLAVEDRLDVLLRLGKHREVIDELIGLVDADPTRERLVGQLMLALYRGGQAGRALEVFRRTKELLAEELGIDPGVELRRLEVAILRDDSELVLPRPSGEPATVTSGPAIVGRGRELAQLTAWRDQAAAGRPVVVLVEGAAGIGKTTVLEELGRRSGMPVLYGRGVAEEGAPAYWPWRQIFRQWLAGADPTEAAALLGDATDKIARILPEIRHRLRTGKPVELSQPAAEERFALFDHVAELVTGIAKASGGLVITVDDLHWADPAALLLFTHLARSVVDGPLLLVGAFRSYELRQAPRGSQTLAELSGLAGAHRLELAGLSAEEVAEQLTDVIGRPCDAVEAAAVAHRTGGNPLFVREVGRLRRANPKASITDVPTAARDAIRQYVSVLSPTCQTLLTTASVLAAEIDPLPLAAVAGRSVEDVLDALDEATGAAVVLGAGRSGFRFAHDLVRDSLSLDVTPADRARIHLRAAEHLEKDTKNSHLAQIAHHRLTALPLGDAELAARAAADAAALAMDQLAYEDAARWFDQALTAQAALDAKARGELLIGKATAHYLAYDVALARSACEKAAALAIQEGDAVALGWAALVMPDQNDPSWLSTIKPWCARALASLSEKDSALRARLLAQQVVIDSVAGDVGAAMRISGEALAMAERVDDPDALIAALRARQNVFAGADGLSERLALSERMIELAWRAGDQAALWGHLWRFDALMQAGRVQEAEGQLEQLEPVLARLNQPLASWHVYRGWAAIHHGRGQIAEAHRDLDEATRLAEHGQNPFGVTACEFSRSFVDTVTRTDMRAESEDRLRRGLPWPAVARIGLAFLCVLYGRLDDAREVYRDFTPLGSTPMIPSLRMAGYAQYGIIAGALGDVATSETVYRELLPHADLHMTSGTGVTTTGGSVHRILGITAAACGHIDTAIDHYRAAVTANAASGLVPSEADSRFRLAELLHQRGRPGDQDDAVTNAKAAHAIATRIGMPLLRADTEGLLAAING